MNEPEINEDLLSSSGKKLSLSELAATYTEIDKAAYAGAREGNSSVNVLAGAMSYADLPFLKELYKAGIKGYYDGISFHPYSDQAPPENSMVTHSFIRGIEEVHNLQTEEGDSTPEWSDEFGWFVGESEGFVTEAQQAEYIEKAFTITKKFTYIKGAVMYQLRDLEENLKDPEDNFGLLRTNFTARSSFAAFKTAMANWVAATTESATGVTMTGATLNGSVNPEGEETKYYFEYGKTVSYGKTTAEESAGSGASGVKESKAITGLEPSTTYHFRIVATNTTGTAYGKDETFITT